MNKERLLDVAAVLEGVPAERFNMMLWGSEQQCGTVACAAGNYCLARPDSGLMLEKDRSGEYDIVMKDERGKVLAVCWDAVDLHFDLTREQSRHLFAWDKYAEARVQSTRANVIQRIRDFVAAGA